jgi:hypothetical protein
VAAPSRAGRSGVIVGDVMGHGPEAAAVMAQLRAAAHARTRSFDHGILALRSVLPCGPGQLDTACDRLISSLAERFEDDVTVVLARIR